jgi:hypothetical protein
VVKKATFQTSFTSWRKKEGMAGRYDKILKGLDTDHKLAQEGLNLLEGEPTEATVAAMGKLNRHREIINHTMIPEPGPELTDEDLDQVYGT